MLNNIKLKYSKNIKYVKNPIIKGTIILTLAGILTRIIGFFFRIFLSRSIGAEGIGIYQLIFPLQIICYSLCTVGIETAISKLVASVNSTNKKSSFIILKCGLFISLIISIITCIVVYMYAPFISSKILLETRCVPLVKIMSFSIPLASIHACICGYYLGVKKTSIPAWSQLIEQIIRVFSIYIIVDIATKNNLQVTPSVAVVGSLIGEFFSVIYTIYCISSEEKKVIKKSDILSSTKSKIQLRSETSKKYSKKLFFLSIPLTLNKLMTSILQSIQNVMIPNRLIAFGLSSSMALSVFGIIMGLVLPLIMFPGALINSIALMLLPTIAEAENNNQCDKINNTSKITLAFSCLFGIYCSGIFIEFGNEIGTFLFSSPESGKYITILGFLCPFVYCISTLASIINGLGYTLITFIHSTISTIIQIIFTVFLVPIIGIKGFLFGLLISCIISAISHYISAAKYVSLSFSAMDIILIPILCVIFMGEFVNLISKPMLLLPPIISILIKILVYSIVFLLVSYRAVVRLKKSLRHN